MKFTRRELVRRYGPAALLLWPVLSSSRAWAATPQPRFVTFFSSSGVMQDRFWPTGTPGSASSGNYRVDGTTLAGLKPHLADLIIPKGITINRGGGDSHNAGSASILTGNDLRDEELVNRPNAYGPSLDYVLSKRFTGTPEPMLRFGVRLQIERVSKYVSYDDTGTELPYLQDPYTAYQRVFKRLIDACVAAGVPPPVNVRDLKRRSLLDAVRKDTVALKQRAGLDGEERQKLDRMETAIRSVERQVAEPAMTPDPNPRCEGAQRTFEPASPVPNQDSKFPQLLNLFMDLTTLALEMNVTRVVTLSLSLGGSGGAPMSWLNWTDASGVPRPIDAGHHNITHGERNGVLDHERKLPVVDRWNFDQFAAMVSRLKAVNEGGSTLLDNSLLWYASDVGDGRYHTDDDMPFLVAGRAGGALQTGRYVQFANQPNHQRLLLSFLHAMGFQDSTFGKAGSTQGGPLL